MELEQLESAVVEAPGALGAGLGRRGFRMLRPAVTEAMMLVAAALRLSMTFCGRFSKARWRWWG